MATTKQMQDRARAAKQAAKQAQKNTNPGVQPVSLYPLSKVRLNTGLYTTVVFPEGMVRLDTDIANVLVYPANSNKPVVSHMTNSGAVYMAGVEGGCDRDLEYILEITQRDNYNGILIQSGVISKQPVSKNDMTILAARILKSVPESIKNSLAGNIEVHLIDAAETGHKVGWVG